MNTSHLSSELQKGLWMVAPQMADQYIHSATTLITAPYSLANSREMQAIAIREVMTPEGIVINSREDEVPPNSVGIVRTIGSMSKYGSWYNWGSDELVAMMWDYENHPNIIGQVHHDDSGGGTVSSVAPYLDFHKKRTKPVGALVDTCASANYWKNCAADFINAENDISAMIGSVGVMLEVYDYTKMLSERGIVQHIIESDLSDDKNKAYKLAIQGKYKLIKKEMLNPLAIKFQDTVKQFRPNITTGDGELSGKLFYAEEALDKNMIDGISDLETAIDKVKFLASARTFISMNN